MDEFTKKVITDLVERISRLENKVFDLNSPVELFTPPALPLKLWTQRQG
jgi:archaellum component FlaC